MSSYKLTRKAEADLESLVAISFDRFGSEATLQLLDNLERHIKALAEHEYEGPKSLIGSRARPVRRWPVPPYWLYYDRVGGILRAPHLPWRPRAALTLRARPTSQASDRAGFDRN